VAQTTSGEFASSELSNRIIRQRFNSTNYKFCNMNMYYNVYPGVLLERYTSIEGYGGFRQLFCHQRSI